MVTCKHSSSATATTQACDVGSQFRTIKTLVKSTTEENLPNVAVKGLFVQELDEAKKNGVLDLNLKDRKALIDHVATMGDILTGVMTKKTVKKGFIVNGMIDKKTELYPDLHAILKTCKREITKEEEELVFTSFPVLYKTMLDKGHIHEDLFTASSNYHIGRYTCSL